jgi:hypothetical protein
VETPGTEPTERYIAREWKSGFHLRRDLSQLQFRVWHRFLSPLLLSPGSVDVARIIEIKRLFSFEHLLTPDCGNKSENVTQKFSVAPGKFPEVPEVVAFHAWRHYQVVFQN